MDERDLETLRGYCREMADRLGLRDTIIEVAARPCDGSSDATAFICDWCKKATISVCEDFRTRLPEDQREYTIHELLHVVYAGADNVVRVDLEASRQLSVGTYDLLKASYDRQLELAIDGLATAIAPLFPLIDWAAEGVAV